MLDTQRIRSRIKELRRRVFELKTKFKPLSEDELITDETLYNAAEHHLQIAIQCCLDIAAHIVSALVLPVAKQEVGELFLSLAKEKIISQNLAKTMREITGYRNILVHEYLGVERHQTYLNIQKGLKDIVRFAKEIEEFLGKNKGF